MLNIFFLITYFIHYKKLYWVFTLEVYRGNRIRVLVKSTDKPIQTMLSPLI